MNEVLPKSVEGWNMSLTQLFGESPKFTIVCGNCQCAFKSRTELVDEPRVMCPHCSSINRIPLTWE